MFPFWGGGGSRHASHQISARHWSSPLLHRSWLYSSSPNCSTSQNKLPNDTDGGIGAGRVQRRWTTFWGMAVRSSAIRNAYKSLRAPAARVGSRFAGVPPRCHPVGPANHRMALRWASSTTSGTSTSPNFTANLGARSQKEGGLECGTSVR